jgi:hypothetical protein
MSDQTYEVRLKFAELINEFGTEWEIVQHSPTGPNDGECWTRAWNRSNTEGLEYAEGFAVTPRSLVIHGFSVKKSLLGETVIESTEGFEKALAYKGFVINTQHPHVIKVIDLHRKAGDPNSSVLETILYSQPWERVREVIK